MKPHKVSFYVYADSEVDVSRLERALHDFVVDRYSEGIPVTASRLTDILARFGGNPYIKSFLNGNTTKHL